MASLASDASLATRWPITKVPKLATNLHCHIAMESHLCIISLYLYLVKKRILSKFAHVTVIVESAIYTTTYHLQKLRALSLNWVPESSVKLTRKPGIMSMSLKMESCTSSKTQYKSPFLLLFFTFLRL